MVWGEFDGGDDPDAAKWRKTEPIEVAGAPATPRAIGDVTSAGRDEFAAALARVGADGMICEFHAELELGKDGPELVVTLVNVSPRRSRMLGHERVRGEPAVDAGDTLPFTLDNLPIPSATTAPSLPMA